MANTGVWIREVRFVIEDELTECYVRLEGDGVDEPIGVTGWHHKSFPASKSTLDILNGVADGSIESWLLWPLNAPRSGS